MMSKIVLLCLMFMSSLFAEKYNLYKDEYLVMDFEKRIKSVKASNNAVIQVDYNRESKKPFRQLIVYGQEYGKANLYITYVDGQNEKVRIHVEHDLETVKTSLQSNNASISLDEFNKDKYILKGDFYDDKEKNRVLTMLNRADINSSKDVIDMSNVENFPAIVQIKMYIVEMSNKNIDEFKSNIILEDILGDTTMDVNMITDQSLTLDGMFTSAIKHFGSQFNIVHALKVLKQKELATVLDESTLSVMEGEKTAFHSGGTIYVRVQGTTQEGQPISSLKELEYGIKLDIELNKLNKRNKTVMLTIDTQKTSIDWSRQVDGIPGFGKKSIVTKIAARNNQAIILSGLVTNEDTKVIKKIPLLGDIPVLGKLFRSESFIKGNSELMFFLIPEIQTL